MEQNSLRSQRMIHLTGTYSLFYRAVQVVNLTKNTIRNETPFPQRLQESHLWEFPSDLDRSWLELSDDDSNGPVLISKQGLWTWQLESLDKAMERFDHSNAESTIDDYTRETEHCLLGIANPYAPEELRLIWRTSSRSVCVFMESLQYYSSLCQKCSWFRGKAYLKIKFLLQSSQEH